MLDHFDSRAVMLEPGSQLRIGPIGAQRRNGRSARKVDTSKNDPGIGLGWQESQRDLLASPIASTANASDMADRFLKRCLHHSREGNPCYFLIDDPLVLPES